MPVGRHPSLGANVQPSHRRTVITALRQGRPRDVSHLRERHDAAAVVSSDRAAVPAPSSEEASMVTVPAGYRGLVPRYVSGSRAHPFGGVSDGSRHRGSTPCVMAAEVAGIRLRRQRREGIRHREVNGSSGGKRSGGRNPKDAAGMKQGRKGPGRSARREAARNRTRRLPG